MRSSSPRPSPQQTDGDDPAVVEQGLVICNGRVTGSVRLPAESDAFVEQFNQTYSGTGMQIIKNLPRPQ
jgi:hypothetical protein